VARALTSDKLQLSVVQDLFLNPTSRLADYVLPAAHWLEKPYFSLGLGFMAFVGDYVGGNRSALKPDTGHYSDYDLWRDLGKRLGQTDAWPDTADDFYDSCLRPAGISFEQVCTERGPMVGSAVRNPDRTLEDGITPPPFGTPSGKVELKSSLLARWGFDPLPRPIRPGLTAQSEAYPCVLTTGGRDIDGFHQNAQQTSRFRRKNPDPIVTLNEDTAARAGITEGDWVVITTPVGSVRQIAHLTSDLGNGVVRADRWWYPENADDTDDSYGFWSTNINVCTVSDDANSDELLGSWLMRGVPCRIESATS
jgi:anaerobic selenocysteine-containing dehydrogenase